MKSGDDRPTVPPVRLPPEAELARDALASPLLSRAARLARWSGSGVPVGAGGELLPKEQAAAVAHLGLTAEAEGDAETAEAWNFAVDTGLVEIEETGDGTAKAAAGGGSPDEAAGTAAPGEELPLLTGEAPAEVLRIWTGGLEAVLEDAATPGFEELLGGLDGVLGEDGRLDPEALDPEALNWDPDEESEFLDAALANLYLLTATDESVAAGAMAPLPVVAAAMVIPEETEEPSEEELSEVSGVMMQLDGQFRVLAGTGLLDYRPVDDALMTDEEPESGQFGEEGEAEDLARYGQVRLTPLGLYGVRQRMLEAGVDAPLVGDLAGQGAAVLLAALPGLPSAAAREEAEGWLAGREPAAAARELLAAARGGDAEGPSRRLGCQLALSLLDQTAAAALREVLDDGQLGGLARVWLAERGVVDVPPPSEDMIFWLTIDTLAAQLTASADLRDTAELQILVQDLTEQHTGFFDKAWRTRHPATADVLEAMGQLHPDKELAKQARKAAFKARSQE